MRTVKPPDDTAWPLYQLEANLMHYPIFKNAHSSLSDWLKGKPFLFTTWIRDDIPTDAVGFAVLREPFSRYVSGLAQIWRMGLVAGVGWETFVDGVERHNREKSKPYTALGDRHFLPQANVVDRMPETRILFPLDELDRLLSWVEERAGSRRRIELDHQKRTEETMIRYAETRLTKAIIDRHYDRDVALWETIR